MKYKILLGLTIYILASCNLPEHYYFPVPECVVPENFSALNDANSEAYQTMVKKELKGKSCDYYRYFFKTFMDEERKTYMLTNFRNEHTCFDAKLLVNKWDKLQGMKRTNGKSYPNELFDLKWELKAIKGKEEIVYKDMHEIID